jgi:perosamine synthetase
MTSAQLEVTRDAATDLLTASILSAVRAVVPATRGKVALHEPQFNGNEWKYVKECLDTGWVSSVGSYVDRFEQMLSGRTGAAHVVATANGTAALHVCLQLVGVERGDEVVIPTLTFIATANAVSYMGATPHFVDSDPRTLGMDALKLNEHLRSIATVRDGMCVNDRTGAVIRAVMPMHTFGHPVDIDGLLEVCERWRVALVEDAAESLGSYYKGRHTGTFGRVAALSFNGNKVITTGGGGAIVTNDATLGKRAKHLTTTARVAHKWSFIHDEVGYNYLLPNLNAALGCAQLEQLDGFVESKRALAQHYIGAFGGVKDANILVEPAECRSNYWLNTLLLDRRVSIARDAVLDSLNSAGLMSRPAWTLMHKLPMYANCPRADVSCAEDLEARIINLPSSAALGG